MCGSYDDNLQLQFLVQIFHSLRKYYTKKNLIESSLSIFLDDSYDTFQYAYCQVQLNLIS